MKRLFDLFKPSLLTRVALALGLIGLLPVGFLAYRLVGINIEAMEDQVELTQTRAAVTVADRIESELRTYFALANSLAGNPVFSDARSAAAQDHLRYNLGAWSPFGVLGIAVVNPDGEQVLLAQLLDPESRRRVREALEMPGRDLVEILVRDWEPTDADRPVARSKTIVDLRVAGALPEQRGFIWLVADGSIVRDAVTDPEQVGQYAELTLAHRDGFAIFGSLEEFPEEILEYAFDTRVEGFKPSFRTSDGEVISAFSPVDTAPWAVLTRQRLEEAHAVSNAMLRESWLTVGLVGLGIVMLSGLAYTTTVRPIRELAAAQRRLAGGAPATAGSEIDQLRASFDALEERMKDRSALDEVFLGRYQVREVIGSGAMGTVFLGYDPKLQRPVALKTIRLDQRLGSDKRQELLTRLLQEAVTTAKFSHPNIVSVYDVEDRGGSAFMAMEYIDGDSLERFVWRQGRLEAGELALVGAAIARALAAAHENRLVHRDVKPANILLGRDGSIKVTDFGISQLFSAMSDREDVVFGTPGYLPPEALQGKGYDASGDLFSLGAVLHFCATGQRPFEGKTIKEVIRKTLFDTVVPASQIVPGIPAELDSLILSLLSTKRSRRPHSARAVAERLEQIARDREATWEPRAAVLNRDDQQAVGPSAAFMPTTRMTSSGPR